MITRSSQGPGVSVVTSLGTESTGEGSQISMMAGCPVAAGAVLAPHSTVVLPGQVVNVGACVSRTEINWVQVAVLFDKSVALNVRVNVYVQG